MKLLLLGATGDIGRHVVRLSLRELPAASVTIYVRNTAKLYNLLGADAQSSRVKVICRSQGRVSTGATSIRVLAKRWTSSKTDDQK